MSNEFIMVFSSVNEKNGSNKYVQTTTNVDQVSWDDLVESFQDMLADAGYIFDEEFDMAEILRNEHENLLARLHPTATKSAVFPFGMETTLLYTHPEE